MFRTPLRFSRELAHRVECTEMKGPHVVDEDDEKALSISGLFHRWEASLFWPPRDPYYPYNCHLPFESCQITESIAMFTVLLSLLSKSTEIQILVSSNLLQTCQTTRNLAHETQPLTNARANASGTLPYTTRVFKTPQEISLCPS
jgi:hypothetical protein